jgi:RNA polymerase sigma-70 factor (sigma-E family)
MAMDRSEALKAGRVTRVNLGDLYARHAAPLQGLAYLLTGDHHLAEDITHQAFIKFYGRFQNLREPTVAAAYLKRTVVNLARNHHRHAKIEHAYLNRHAHSDQSTYMPSVEEHDLVIGALIALPYRQRAVLVLRFYEDMTEAQAATVMGCSPGAVKSLTARAMSSLKITMKGADDD